MFDPTLLAIEHQRVAELQRHHIDELQTLVVELSFRLRTVESQLGLPLGAPPNFTRLDEVRERIHPLSTSLVDFIIGVVKSIFNFFGRAINFGKRHFKVVLAVILVIALRLWRHS